MGLIGITLLKYEEKRTSSPTRLSDRGRGR